MFNQLNTVCFVLAIYTFSFVPIFYFTELVGISKRLMFVTFLATSFLICLVKNKWLFIKCKTKRRTLLLATSFSFYAFISYLISGDYLIGNQTVMVLSCLNLTIVFIALNNSQFKSTIVGCLLLLSAIYFLRVTFMLFDNTLMPGVYYGKVQVFNITETDGYNNINMYLGIFALVAFTSIFYKRRVPALVIASVVCLFTLYLMFYVGGRAPIIGILAVIMTSIFSFVYKNYLNIRRSHIALISTVVMIVAIIAIAFDLEKLYAFTRFTDLLKEGDTSDRLFLYSEAIELFLSTPVRFFFGAGMGYYSVYIENNIVGMYPHNLILELLAEYGIVGAVLFLSLPIYLLRLRKKRLGSFCGNNFSEHVLFNLFLYFFVMAMFIGGLSACWPLMFSIAILYTQNKNQEDLTSYTIESP